MLTEKLILEIIDHVGAWTVLAISEWACPTEKTDDTPVDTAQKILGRSDDNDRKYLDDEAFAPDN